MIVFAAHALLLGLGSAFVAGVLVGIVIAAWLNEEGE